MRAPRAAALAAAMVVSSSALSLDAPLPGPGPRPLPPSIPGVGAPRDEACARCHPAIAAEWRASMHGSAAIDRYYQATAAVDPTPAFCAACHAPERVAGIGCVTCHVGESGVIGARGRPHDARAHAVLADARLATSLACARCHEFAFPDGGGALMQSTVSEHAASAFRETPCQGCHMPLGSEPSGAAHARHDFTVQGDRALLARAVRVLRATLRGGMVEIELAPGRIGHAFPTGDLHRRVEIRATPEGGKGPREPAVFALARSFAHDARSGAMRQVADTRLPAPGTAGFPGSMTVRLTLTDRAAPRARYQIVWQRMPREIAAQLRTPMSAQEIVLQEGILDARR